MLQVRAHHEAEGTVRLGLVCIMKRPSQVTVNGKTATIPLYSKVGVLVCFATIDADVAEAASHYRWCLINGYVITRGKGVATLLHHFVVGKPPDGKVTDHINRDPLDNRRKNLRFVTQGQNRMNQGLRSDNASGVAGVYWYAGRFIWRAHIRVHGTLIDLGCYKKKQKAVMARRNAEQKYFGAFAPLWERQTACC